MNYSIVPFSPFFTVPTYFEVKLPKFVYIQDKKQSKIYICRTRRSCHQLYITCGTAVEHTGPQPAYAPVIDSDHFSAYEFVLQPSPQVRITSNFALTNTDFLLGLPFSASCQIQTRFFRLQITADGCGLITDAAAATGPFARPRLATNMYCADLSALVQLNRYVQQPLGGALVSGPGAEELVDFVLGLNGIQSKIFKVEPETVDEDLATKYRTAIFGSHTENGPQQSFNALMAGDTGGLVFRNQKLARREAAEPEDARLTAQILQCFDTVQQAQKLLRFPIIAIVPDIDAVDPALRRAGRLGTEITVENFSAEQRRRWIALGLKQFEYKSNNLNEYVERCRTESEGFVQQMSAEELRVMTEVVQSTNGVALQQFDRTLRKAKGSTVLEKITNFAANIRCVNRKHQTIETLETTKHEAFQPSNNILNVNYQVIGLSQQLQTLIKNFACKDSLIAQSLKIIPDHALLYGQTGSGKSLLLQLLKNSLPQMNFLLVQSTNIYSQYVGESEQNIRKIFSEAKRQRPAIVIFDNLDLLINKSRDSEEESVGQRVLAQLLTELDGVSTDLGDVYCIGTICCEPKQMDPAIVRVKRFGLHVNCNNIDDNDVQKYLQWINKDIQQNDGESIQNLILRTQEMSK